MVWFKFAACVAIILFAGTRLTRYGDALAEKTGWGRLWIGLVLLAAITSMPELVAGLGSAGLVGLPNLAMGDIMGSCMFNLLILAMMDIFYRRDSLLELASTQHIPMAGVGIVLIAVAAGGIWQGDTAPSLGSGWVGAGGIAIPVLYMLGVWWVFRREQKAKVEWATPVAPQYAHLPAKTVYIRLAASAAAVVGAGIWLAYIGDELSLAYQLNTSFVGSLFLAVSTSLPEIVVTFAALRLGAVDMAIANILGSNMFNMAIIGPVDLAYERGPLLASVSRVHMTTALLSIAMSAVVIIALRFRHRGRIMPVGWYTPVLIGLYAFGIRQLFLA